jgi:hypothetical protein
MTPNNYLVRMQTRTKLSHYYTQKVQPGAFCALKNKHFWCLIAVQQAI